MCRRRGPDQSGMSLALERSHGEPRMAVPKNSTRIERASPDQGVRRWRQGDDVRGRDNRPGHYSVTGEFIVLPESRREARNSNRRS